MLYDEQFRDPEKAERILGEIRRLSEELGPVRLMEVCGTHTMAIARMGLKSLLPREVRLISGPGCPVCVTPAGVIDQILELSSRPGITVASYGDLLRVPGSRKGDCLLYRKALGARVEAVYSPLDALKKAKEQPDRQIVFLGVGFETTAPGTAACILEAARCGIGNFSVYCLLKQTPPALRALIEAPDFAVQGFLCPGHVAAVTGSSAFSFLPEEYGLPAAVAGFEAGDILYSVLRLLQMLSGKKPGLVNEYIRLVKPEGNQAALGAMKRVLETCESRWRGLGTVKNSGMAIRKEFAPWDAARKFSLGPEQDREIPGCLCARVIRGVAEPEDCPMFGKGCTPAGPVGPCMVSGEGACAAAYRYGKLEV